MKSLRTSRWIALAIIAAMVLAFAPALPSAQAAGGVLAYGDVVNGQINNKSYFELWQFDGIKGDRVQITMAGDGQLDPYLGLIEGASEQVLVEDDDSAGNGNAMVETTLPSSGTFVIVATRYGFDTGTSQGAYQLELQGGTGPQGNAQNPVSNVSEPQEVSPGVFFMGEMALGTPVSGTLDNSSYAQIYAVQAEKGTNFVVAMFADASNLDAYIIFATEAGDVLAEDDDSGAQVGGTKTDAFVQLVIPETGNYLIVATRSGLDAGTSSGNYALVAGVPEESGQQTNQQQPVPEPQPQNTNLPAGMEYVGDIAMGDSMSGTISNETFVQLYTFSGSAGDTVTITMKGDGNLDPYIGLIDPNDNVVAEDDDSGGGTGGVDAQISIRLTESGTYVIAATRSGIDQGDTVGNYTLDLISGPPPAPEGSVSGVGGFGGLPGRAFVSGDQTFFLRGMGRTDNPDKAAPLEHFLQSQQGENLPGRSFKPSGESFYLSGFGKTTDPAKKGPLAAYLGK
jgi:hypothetical protein